MKKMNESLHKILYYENILQFKENTQCELTLRDFNFWQLCRTCLAETKESGCDLEKMFIMDALEGRFLNVQEMPTKVTTIQLSRDKELPLMMCKDCLEKLTILYYFSIQIKRASVTLKKLSPKLKGEANYTAHLIADLEDPEFGAKASIGGQERVVCAVEDVPEVAADSNCQIETTATKLIENTTGYLDFKVRNAKEELEADVRRPDGVGGDLELNTIKKEKCEFSKSAESHIYLEEHVNVQEHLHDMNDNSPSIPYDVNEEEGPQQTDIDNIETGKHFKTIENPPEDLDLGAGKVKEELEAAKLELNIKQELCEYPEKAESQIYLEDNVEHEELLNDMNGNSPQISYVVKEEEELQQTDINIEEIEVYFKDELEEYLTEKQERIDDDTVFRDEKTSSSCSEPIKILKTQSKAIRKTVFKHKQPRVTKPLLESTKCAVCQKAFKSQRDLVSHVKESHPNSKAFHCRECYQLFSHIQSLSRHMNTHKPVLKKNICSYCSKAFLRLDELTRHIRTHTDERPYGCPMCEKAFKQQCDMKQHLDTHMQRKNYECPHCDKVLTSRKSFYVHKKTHNKPMEHHLLQCLHCPKSFANKTNFISHEKQHSREKNRSCARSSARLDVRKQIKY